MLPFVLQCWLLLVFNVAVYCPLCCSVGYFWCLMWRCVTLCVAVLVNPEDHSLRFLAQNPVDAMLAIELAPNEFMLLFNGRQPEGLLLGLSKPLNSCC